MARIQLKWADGAEKIVEADSAADFIVSGNTVFEAQKTQLLTDPPISVYKEIPGRAATGNVLVLPVKKPKPPPPAPPKVPTREELIAICERGRVRQERWMNRDTADAQRQMGEAWALLSAGCDFTLEYDKRLNTWWVTITFHGFNYFEDGAPSTERFYLPTIERLETRRGGGGEDWY